MKGGPKAKKLSVRNLYLYVMILWQTVAQSRALYSSISFLSVIQEKENIPNQVSRPKNNHLNIITFSGNSKAN